MVQPFVDVLAVKQGLKLSVSFNAPIFAHPKEYDPVNSPLDCKVEVADAQFGVADGKVFCQSLSPRFDLG